MKYPSYLYARAFLEVMEKTPERKRGEILKRFVQLLFKNGDIRRADKIIEAVSRFIVQARGGRSVAIEYARIIPAKLRRKLTGAFSKKDAVTEILNPVLVAGVRITMDGNEELDMTMARKLKKVFQI